jgi:2,4-dienoyl-CoA reductase-like NADH-dependent reductase (Old Yellow Enzyme family)
MKTLSANKLFTPIQVGPMELTHRVVMAPLTRSRSVQPGGIPGDLMLEYYTQRASEGGLIGRGMVRGTRLPSSRFQCNAALLHPKRQVERALFGFLNVADFKGVRAG